MRRHLLLPMTVILAAGGAQGEDYGLGPVLPEADLTVREISTALHAAKLGQHIDYTGLDLTYLDLAGLDFKGAILAKTDLYGTDFTDAKLTKSDLTHARLDRAVLTRTVFFRLQSSRRHDLPADDLFQHGKQSC
jgi:Uncharacterized low-complexity proteins